MDTPQLREPQIEVHASAQPSLTALVRARRRDLGRELSRALHAAHYAAGNAASRRALVAFHRCDPKMVELAIAVPLSGGLHVALPLAATELPAGRYLMLASGLSAPELASVLSRLRDWIAVHHESAIGPLLLELVHDQLILRQRILGGRASAPPSSTMVPLRDKTLATVVQALGGAQRAQALEVAC